MIADSTGDEPSESGYVQSMAAGRFRGAEQDVERKTAELAGIADHASIRLTSERGLYSNFAIRRDVELEATIVENYTAVEAFARLTMVRKGI